MRGTAPIDLDALLAMFGDDRQVTANLLAAMLSAAAPELEQACHEATDKVRAIKHRVTVEQAQSVRDAA